MQNSILRAQHHSKRPYYTASKFISPPYSPTPFISPVTSSLPAAFLFLNFPNLTLSSNHLSIPHQSHTCGLQPVLGYLYYKDPQDAPSKSFALHPLLYLAAAFPISSICLTYLPSSKTISYFNSNFYLSSF